jgi:hypothetical protein
MGLVLTNLTGISSDTNHQNKTFDHWLTVSNMVAILENVNKEKETNQ